MGAGFLVGLIGVLILSHATYSTIQYRALLKITEEEFSGPPIDVYQKHSLYIHKVVVELIVSLVLCLWAAMTAPGSFKSIHPHSEENRVVALPANLDFMIFNHRGKIFPLETELKLK